jgi:multicomponent Na+:H+ antiporter subunit G
MVEWIAAGFLIVGGLFALVAGIGVLRLQDVFMRMHASTKAGTLGVGLILVALAVLFADIASVSRSIAAFLFILITAPVAAHVVGRAAHRTGQAMWDRTHRDDLRPAQEQGQAKRRIAPTTSLDE